MWDQGQVMTRPLPEEENAKPISFFEVLSYSVSLTAPKALKGGLTGAECGALQSYLLLDGALHEAYLPVVGFKVR